MPTRTRYIATLELASEHVHEIVRSDAAELHRTARAYLAIDIDALILTAQLLASPAEAMQSVIEAGILARPDLASPAARHLIAAIITMFDRGDDARRLVSATCAATWLTARPAHAPHIVSEAWRLHAEALRASGQYAHALEALEIARREAQDALDRDYHDALVSYSTALTYLDLKQPHRASEHLGDLAARFVRHGDARRAASVGEVTAYLHYSRGDYAGAACAYRTAIANATVDRTPALLNNLGRCHLKLGDTVAAESTLRRAIVLAARSADLDTEANARRNLAELLDDAQGLLAAAAIFESIGYLGEVILVQLAAAESALRSGSPAQTLVPQCRSIALRAFGTGLESHVARQLVDLERLAAHGELTEAHIQHVRTMIPSGLRTVTEVVTN